MAALRRNLPFALLGVMLTVALVIAALCRMRSWPLGPQPTQC
jgi:hypothetical protein